MTDSKITVGTHKVFLIRHGETVDNVAGLYAGIRDSALTNHGVQQANRLGQFFSKAGITFDNIYSSDLSRARRTAEALLDTARDVGTGSHFQDKKAASIVQLQELREQDFGFYEGKPFYARSPNSSKSGKDTHREEHKEDEGFQDFETKESMAKRADAFLDQHLMPLLSDARSDRGLTVAVVSHGMLLSSLWRCILRKQSPNSISLDPELVADMRPVSLEHLGGFSNTGYLELELSSQLQFAGGIHTSQSATVGHATPGKAANLVTEQPHPETIATKKSIVVETSEPVAQLDKTERSAGTYNILIKSINGKEHLKGLKRTGGGLGSAKHDESQKKIGSFFKKQKT